MARAATMLRGDRMTTHVPTQPLAEGPESASLGVASVPSPPASEALGTPTTARVVWVFAAVVCERMQ